MFSWTFYLLAVFFLNAYSECARLVSLPGRCPRYQPLSNVDPSKVGLGILAERRQSLKDEQKIKHFLNKKLTGRWYQIASDRPSNIIADQLLSCVNWNAVSYTNGSFILDFSTIV
jgi:hypothetical protein